MQLLTETLDAIAMERERSAHDRSFRLARELLKELGEHDLAARLYSAIPPDRPWRDVADLFNILIWSTSDNGHALAKATEQWLRNGTDARRTHIALHLDGCPFTTFIEMEAILNRLAQSLPEVEEECEELIELRRRVDPSLDTRV
jgi:hypothetical protein